SEQHFDVWKNSLGPFSYFGTTHRTWHHDIAEQQVDIDTTLENCHRALAVTGLQNRVAEIPEHDYRSCPDCRVIFHHEYGFRPPRESDNAETKIFNFRIKGARQIDLKGCTAADFTINPDVAATLFGKPVCHTEPKAGAFTFLFCRKKRFKGMFNYV